MASATPLTPKEIAEMRKVHISLADQLERLYMGSNQQGIIGRAVQSVRAGVFGTEFVSAQASARSGASPVFQARGLWAQYDAAPEAKANPSDTTLTKAEILDHLRKLDPAIGTIRTQIAQVATAKKQVQKKLFQAHDTRGRREQIEEQNTRGMTATPDGLRIAALGGYPSARQQWYRDLHDRLEPLGLMDFLATLLEIFGAGNSPDAILMRELCKARDALNATEQAAGGQGRKFGVVLEADGDFTLICLNKDGTSARLDEAERLAITTRINQNLAAAVKASGSEWYQGLSVTLSDSSLSGASVQSAASAAAAAAGKTAVASPPPAASAPVLGPTPTATSGATGKPPAPDPAAAGALVPGGTMGRDRASSGASVDSTRTADPT